jgi:hypothetical protein
MEKEVIVRGKDSCNAALGQCGCRLTLALFGHYGDMADLGKTQGKTQACNSAADYEKICFQALCLYLCLYQC